MIFVFSLDFRISKSCWSDSAVIFELVNLQNNLQVTEIDQLDLSLLQIH